MKLLLLSKKINVSKECFATTDKLNQKSVIKNSKNTVAVYHSSFFQKVLLCVFISSMNFSLEIDIAKNTRQKGVSQPAITCSKLTTKTLEQEVKYVQLC